MILRDLLAELRDNILRDTSTALTSANDDSLWSDETLVRYIRDAEEKFASSTLCLRDIATPALCQLTLVAGQADYPLDRRVLVVYAASHGLLQLGHGTYASRYGQVGDLSPAYARYESDVTGTPKIFYTDRATASLGVYPTPDADAALTPVKLQVARLPLNPLSTANLDAEPEIPSEYHLDLLEWAAWRALRNHDADVDADANNLTIVMARTGAHKKRFEEAVAECKRRFKYLNTQHVTFDVRGHNWRSF